MIEEPFKDIRPPKGLKQELDYMKFITDLRSAMSDKGYHPTLIDAFIEKAERKDIGRLYYELDTMYPLVDACFEALREIATTPTIEGKKAVEIAAVAVSKVQEVIYSIDDE